MALLEEQFTETLDAGAPDITYEGNEGKEQQIAQALWDKLPPQVRMQFGNFAQFFSSGAWKKVIAALQQQMQGGPEEEIRETETETIGRAPQEGLGALMPQPRPMAFGGVAGDDGRQAYGLGSILKKITRPIKKVLKSPIGKAALIGGGLGLAGIGPFSGLANTAAGKGLAGFFGQGSWNPLKQGFVSKALNKSWTTPSTLGNLVSKFPGGGWGLAGTAATLAPFGMAATGNWEADETFDNLKLKAAKFGFDYEQMIRDIQNAENEEDYLAVLAQYNLSASDLPPWSSQKHAEGGRAMAQGGRIGYAGGSGFNLKNIDPSSLQHLKQVFTQKNANPKGLSFNKWAMQNYEWALGLAHGGRIRAQEGGLMDLGGMEKDYRNDGGFVPLGEEEKADDVPARLSKNEFVFTADAVRAAGGGDIDQGAEIMENVMKNLERGGEISDESQGQGARDMFATSERLSEVV